MQDPRYAAAVLTWLTRRGMLQGLTKRADGVPASVRLDVDAGYAYSTVTWDTGHVTIWIDGADGSVLGYVDLGDTHIDLTQFVAEVAEIVLEDARREPAA